MTPLERERVEAALVATVLVLAEVTVVVAAVLFFL